LIEIQWKLERKLKLLEEIHKEIKTHFYGEWELKKEIHEYGDFLDDYYAFLDQHVDPAEAFRLYGIAVAAASKK
jgi:hypothetical protein